MRTLFPALAVLLTCSASGAALAESYTTRIEPRAYYGATVTIEEGVRVFRPLPTTRQVIVNPGGQTPLGLSFNDTRVYEQSTSTNYNYHYDRGGGDSVGGVGAWGLPFGYGKFRGHGHGHGHKPGGFGGHGKGGH